MPTQEIVQTIHPPDRKLNIFISHKMPADTLLAQHIGARLGKFGAGRVVVRLAENYPYGDKWREHIQEDINRTDMLIYLHTGEYDDWLFCLFECGMFVNRRNQDTSSLGITTFCKNMDNIAAPLREFNALVMSADAVLKLYRQIYKEPPWAINPTLSDSDFRSDADEIFKYFMGSYQIIHRFDVTPSITIELEKNLQTRQSLATGVLPDDGLVSGGYGWQNLVGKDVNTGDWLWGKLRDSWVYSKVYEYLLSRVIDRAIEGSSTRAILLRSVSTPVLYRLALIRYEELSNGRYRFFFTAAPIDLPFDIPPERAEKKEVTLYHLINLTWYFRRRFVDGLYNKLLGLAAIPPKDRIGVKALCDEIAYEMMDIDAQALSRGVDNPLVTQDALGGDDPQVIEMMRHGKEWYDLRPKVLEAINKGDNLETVAKLVYKVTQINYEFYVSVAEAFNKSAKLLPAPPPIDN